MRMFIVSMRMSTLKVWAAIFAAVFLLCGVVSYQLVKGAESVPTVSYTGVKTEEGRKALLTELGWEVSGDPIEVGEFTVPAEFDRVLAGYNEIQKAQGLDLSRYARKTVTRYTYEVTNYQGYEGKVYANIIVYRNKVVAGDLCAADGKGFVCGLSGK